MKKIIIIILLTVITINCNAQYNNQHFKSFNNNAVKFNNDPTVIVIPTIILTGTIVTVTVLANNNDLYVLDCVALSGIAISAMSYIVIRNIKENTPRKVYQKRIKRFKYL